MSISTIPDHDFVRCKDCAFRSTEKIFPAHSASAKKRPVCIRERPYKPLYGQKGCSKGKRSMA